MNLVASQQADCVFQTGAWLTIMPSVLNNITLISEEFCDNLSLRFGLTCASLPTNCWYGALNLIDHAPNCHLGGLINERYGTYNNE